MPSNNYCPLFSLQLAADWRPWAGVTVLDFGGGATVSIPAITATGIAPGSQVYPDALTALCGRATSTLLSLLTAEGGLAALAVGIDANDRWFAESTTAGWAVTGGGAVLGFTGPVASVNVGGGVWRCTAQADWVRGPFDLGAVALAYTAGGARLTTDEACWSQDVPSATRTISYAGDGAVWGAQGLTRRLTFAAGGLQFDVGAHLDEQGRTVLSGSQSIPVPVWVDTAFRDWLGFTGLETAVLDASGDWTLTSTRPCTGVLCPSRPAESINPTVSVLGNGAALRDGSTASVALGHRLSWEVSAWLDGPLDRYDLARHFVQAFAPLAVPGWPCELYQDFGDCRRTGWTAHGDAYGLAFNVEREGYRGRIEAAISPDADTSWALTWPQALRRRAPLRIKLDQTEDRT